MSWDHKGSSGARGYGWQWQKLRQFVLRRDGGICRCDDCARLQRLRVATEVDHRVPKAKGGTNDADNLCAINTECHKAKTARENGKRPKQTTGIDGWPIDK